MELVKLEERGVALQREREVLESDIAATTQQQHRRRDEIKQQIFEVGAPKQSKGNDTVCV